jgi:hypothetical protein
VFHLAVVEFIFIVTCDFVDESDEEGDGVAPRRKRRQAEKAAEGDVEDTEVGF